jgi:hypothetical protein
MILPPILRLLVAAMLFGAICRAEPQVAPEASDEPALAFAKNALFPHWLRPTNRFSKTARDLSSNILLSANWFSANPQASSSTAEGASLTSPTYVGSVLPPTNTVPLKDCPYDTTHSKECRVHWASLTLSSLAFIGFQTSGNLYTDYWMRLHTGTGKWWDQYVKSDDQWRWNRWNDNNPFLDAYVGHSLMGAITSNLWIQHDPNGMTLEFSNTWPYWRSRLRALAFSTFFSFEWKFGPVSESSIGHLGANHEYQLLGGRSVLTNETGDDELVTTPLGGMLWAAAEDYIDLHVIKRVEGKSRNPFLLLTIQFLNPARATANIFRFRPPWYRDSREVRSSSRWSDPDDSEANYAAPNGAGNELPWGGQHEFGAVWGYSPTGGPLWSGHQDIRYMPVLIRYSYLINQQRNWALRYAPEITALAMLDEPNWGKTNLLNLRRRTYGAGASPEGFQLIFAPNHRLQPFLSNDGGFIVYTDPVLAPKGPQLLYTLDFGAGLNIFTKHYEEMTFGFRYGHLFNPASGPHIATDTQIFYFGVSRFRSSAAKRR